MRMRIFIIIIILGTILSCSKSKNNKTSDNGKILIKVENHTDSLNALNSLDMKKTIYPKYPIIGKEYKFRGIRNSIDYAIGIKRLDSSRIEYVVADNKNGTNIQKGIASISSKNNYQLTEKSILNNNPFKASEFIEQKENCSFRVRIGIDSIGSGNRLLLRFLKKCENKTVTDVSFAN